MKIIKAMGFVLSVGWPVFLIAYGFKMSVTDILILFMGLTSVAFIFEMKGE